MTTTATHNGHDTTPERALKNTQEGLTTAAT